MTQVKCGLCGGTVGSDSLYCSHCNTVFHRGCIMDHFYYNRFCPVCKKNLSYIDLYYGKPPQPTVEMVVPSFTRSQVPERYTVPGQSVPLTIRKPHWPPDVPLFKIPVRRAPYYHRRGLLPQLRHFVFGQPDEATTILEKFRHNRKGMAGVVMLVISVFIAVLAPVLILHDPLVYMVEDPAYVDHPPTWLYPFGTDVFGRDVYSQTLWGFRSALLIALPCAALIGVIGTLVGLVSGYYGKMVDAVLQRVSLTFLVWPSVPLAGLIVFAWGGYQTEIAIIFGVAVSLWPTTSRAIRAEVMSLKTRTFIESAKVSGATPGRIIFRHILPNVIHLTFLYMTIAVASALALEATINFLGFADPGVITWGQMLSFTFNANRGYVTWWSILSPGLAIAYMVLGFFLISVGLRESIGASIRF